MILRAAEPMLLLLLLALPLVWWWGRRLRAMERGRRWAVLAVRTLIVLLLALALARLEYTKQANLLSVYYLLDVSDSIPPTQLEAAKKLVADLNGKMTTRDEAGLIVFGAAPSLETPAVQAYEFDGKIRSVVETGRTDIAGALRLGMSAFPADRMKRLVLVSDGNENDSSAFEVAQLARSNGIPIDVLPIRYESSSDVAVDKVVVQQITTADAPFDIKVYVNAERDTKGTLRLYEDNKLIAEQVVDVQAGRKNPLVVSQRLKEGGFHKYRASFESDNDPRIQNNTAEAFTFLKAEPHVLIVEGDTAQEIHHLAGALQAESIRVTLGGPALLPATLDELQRYDSVILSNVPASAMSAAQMKLIERGVHDLGIGLVMIGGEASFGAGGFQDTPIELALPVSMDVKQKKVLPNGALAIILHTCEIPSGNAWAREISTAALNVLSRQDYFGLSYFGPKAGNTGFAGGYGDHWLWEPAMQQAGDKRAMRTAIKGVAPADMPSYVPTMEMAYKELKDLNTKVKHIVIISDGDAAPPSKEFVTQMKEEGITLSCVAISPHDGQTVTTMENLAYWGGGNFYYPKTANELPRIFTKEATVVRKSLINENTFVPIFAMPSDLLTGMLTGLPQLNGYVVTSKKDLATTALVTNQEDDPLLAHWRYGLGKTVAFTSDAKNRWASDWVQQPVYGAFWSQLVRWSLRETSNQNYQVNTEVRGGTGRVIIDAVDDNGNFRNYLEFDTTVTTPDLRTRTVRVRQVAPGRYEGSFPAQETGTYMVGMKASDGSSDEVITAGLAVSYSPEYQTTRSNDDFLERIAKVTRGTVAGDSGYNPFRHDVTSAMRPTPIWNWLLLLGLLLVPVDIFLRRVYLDWKEIGAWAKGRLGREKYDRQQDADRMGSLLAAKERATAKDEEDRDEQARRKFKERIAKNAESAPPEGDSVFQKPGDAPQGPVTHRSKQTTGSVEPGARGARSAAEGGSFTGSLLEAKRRAQMQNRDTDKKE